MAVTTNIATVRRAATLAVIGKGEASNFKNAGARTVELAASDATSTIDFGNIPSNFRLSGYSVVSWDDCATTGAPTLDIGIFPLKSEFTADDDALTDGLDLATATKDAKVVKDISNYGKRAWEFISGVTSDPKCDVKIKGTVKDAATNQTGTITIELVGYFD